MKKELKALLELTENSTTRKYNSIFKEEKWLDNQEVCLIVNITKRTLQTYKDKSNCLIPNWTAIIILNFRIYMLCSKPYTRTIPTTMDLFTNDNEEIIAHKEMITPLRSRIESILRNYRPVMNGEIYISMRTASY